MNKKNTLIKSLTLFVALFGAVNFGFGQTTLTAGDIAITGFNSDNPDQFSFVLLSDVTINTNIKFTDEGWLSTGGFRGTGEGIITWTATSNLNCGTEIIIAETAAGSNVYTSSFGTASETGSGFDLSTSGDQILAYQGDDATPTFIYAVHFDGTGWSTDATSSNTSAIPTGLTNGLNAVAINDTDNAVYTCSATSDNSAILSAVSTITNWNPSGTPFTLGGCYYSCDLCSGGTVTWNGTWSGTPGITTQVIIETDYNTGNGGAEIEFSACSLKINTGASLTIADNTYVEVENDLTVNGTISVDPYGAFIQNNDSGTVSGNDATVTKRTAPMNAWYEYTYWSSPVSGETIAGGLADSEPSRRYLFNAENFLDTDGNGIDDDDNDWQWLSGTTVMQPGIGYATTLTEFAYSIAPGSSDKQILTSFNGPFNNGEIRVPIYRNNNNVIVDGNPNFIGNPYPSAIDAQLFLDANTVISQNGIGIDINGNAYTDGAIYLWSQDTAPSNAYDGNQVLNFSTADYAIINGLGQTAGGDGEIPDRYIPSGQGFFINMSDSAIPISTDANNVSMGEVVFNNAMRVVGTTENSQFFKSSNSKESSSELNKLWINLTSDNGVFNQTLIGYMDGATNNNDGAFFDAPKNISAGSSAILYTTIENSNKLFAIQGKSPNSLNQDEMISLGFDTNISVPTIYTLSIAQLQGDFLTNNPIYLKDNVANTIHNLSDSDYTFISEVGEFKDRFEIVFTNQALSNDTFDANTNALQIKQVNDTQVRFSTSNNLSIKNVRIYDLLGRQLYNLEGNNSVETYNLSNLNNSVFIAKVKLSNGAIVTKKAIKE
jgi:hypothetical protein